MPTCDSDDVQDDALIGKAFRRSLVFMAGLALVVVAVVFFFGYWNRSHDVERSTELPSPRQRGFDSVALPMIPMTDVTATAGIAWTHVSGMEGEKLLPETMGGGVAVFDFDQDQDQDLLFVGGQSWPWSTAKRPDAPPSEFVPSTHSTQPRAIALYQNDGHGNFTDITQSAGLDINLYGMSPVVGDYDNDGWSDLFITTVGANRLFRNEQGKFREVSLEAGVAGKVTSWSTAAAFLDFDRDGWLDLFVGNYVTWNRELDLAQGFTLNGIGRAYGQPTAFTGTHCELYRNLGNGTFQDVSIDMGLHVSNANTDVPIGKALGVAAVDLNRDGWTDIVVANDTVQNFAFLNNVGKRYTETAVALGLAYDRSGNATGAMGIDCGFFRNDDRLAIAIGNFANEPSSFYASGAESIGFDDLAMATGVGPVSRLHLTFGLFFADLDLDTRPDIVCANGHLEGEISKVQSSQQYAQPPQFFWNAGPSSSTEYVTLGEQQLGPAAIAPMVGRGAACGDLDGDGDLDIILVSNSGPPRLLRNDQSLGNNWMRLKLVGANQSNRDAYGAVVQLHAAGITQTRVVTTTRSYLSQCEAPLTFGLGTAQEIDKLTITWPDGSVSEHAGLSINELHVIKRASN